MELIIYHLIGGSSDSEGYQNLKLESVKKTISKDQNVYVNTKEILYPPNFRKYCLLFSRYILMHWLESVEIETLNSNKVDSV